MKTSPTLSETKLDGETVRRLEPRPALPLSIMNFFRYALMIGLTAGAINLPNIAKAEDPKSNSASSEKPEAKINDSFFIELLERFGFDTKEPSLISSCNSYREWRSSSEYKESHDTLVRILRISSNNRIEVGNFILTIDEEDFITIYRKNDTNYPLIVIDSDRVIFPQKDKNGRTSKEYDQKAYELTGYNNVQGDKIKYLLQDLFKFLNDTFQQNHQDISSKATKYQGLIEVAIKAGSKLNIDALSRGYNPEKNYVSEWYSLESKLKNLPVLGYVQKHAVDKDHTFHFEDGTSFSTSNGYIYINGRSFNKPTSNGTKPSEYLNQQFYFYCYVAQHLIDLNKKWISDEKKPTGSTNDSWYKNGKLIFYGFSPCPNCDKLIDFLIVNGIRFKEIDRAATSPALEDGSHTIVGFNKNSAEPNIYQFIKEHYGL